MEQSPVQTVWNHIIVGAVILIITVFMNVVFRPPSKHIPIQATPQVVERTIEVKKEPSIFKNFSNNEKAALFLVIPFGAMIWTTILALRKIKLERPDRVVF